MQLRLGPSGGGTVRAVTDEQGFAVMAFPSVAGGGELARDPSSALVTVGSAGEDRGLLPLEPSAQRMQTERLQVAR